MTNPTSTQPLRIANASGFYGDRASAVTEMLTGGPIDVLTGDYLAELTMLILAMDRLKHPDRGYAKSFLRQMETGLGLALDGGTKVVVNAGGLNPAGLAEALGTLADNLGLTADIAYVTGDDLLPRAGELGLDNPLAVNAYLGGWGIADALGRGADVVVTGRVTDASLVVGSAAAHFGWTPTDFDALAGAVAAGHVIECGTQATGGNFAFFTEIADLSRPGFPIAEVFADGSSVITKHPDTPGAVTVDTVTAQLLYEITGARYANPDVTARFDTVVLSNDGPDRVRLSGTVGEPPPPTLKVGVNQLGGYRNEAVFVLTGLDIEAKAALVRDQLDTATDVDISWRLARTDHEDASSEQAASALLHAVVRSSDKDSIGRSFTSAAIELALASYPGFHVTAPPTAASPYGVFRSVPIDRDDVDHTVVLADGTGIAIHAQGPTQALAPVADPDLPPAPSYDGATRSAALGKLIGARSGDKGGSANIGVWARTDDAYAWLVHELTVARLGELLPEAAPLSTSRHLFPNLRAMNFVIQDILGEGVASNARFDPQAKALGEWLRSRQLEIPEVLL